MWEKWNVSKRLETIVYLCFFVLMLLCNLMSPFVADDFSYLNSYATGERLTSIKEIFPSMVAHAYTMNGRLTAHFLVQLFTLYPMWVFDAVNAAMFCLIIGLICKMALGKDKNNLLTVSVFSVIWLYVPAFGQVNLWQDGAVNYSWSVAVGLLYLIPFVNRYIHTTTHNWSWPAKTSFLVLSLFAGSYSENVSAAVIFISFLLVLLDYFHNGKRIYVYGISAIVAAILGYITIYMAPAQWMNKSAELSVLTLIKNIIVATQQYETFGILVVLYVFLLVISIVEKVDIKRIWLSVVFLMGSLAANYIMVLASYYPERSALGAVMLLIVANAVLIPHVMKLQNYRTMAVSTMLVLLLATAPALCEGVQDIGTTYLKISNNISIIQQSKETGDLDVELPVIHSATKYSALYSTKYLDKIDPTTWPNYAMAKYYEVNSIIGVD